MHIRKAVASETINRINHIWGTFNEFDGAIPAFIQFAGEDTESHYGLTIQERKEHLENCLSSIHAEATSLAQLHPSDTVSASVEQILELTHGVQRLLETFNLNEPGWSPGGRGYDALLDTSANLGGAIFGMVSAIGAYFQPATPLSTKSVAKGLRHLLSSIKSVESKDFVKEAIQCLEADAYKAAVVFSWIGAVSVLYDYVIAHRLTDFNNEAKTRDAKWKTASTRDDLAKMKEADFLDILAALSILGKNVKEHLKNTCLNLRNSCGHPSSLKVGKHNVEAHIEFLVQNVFAVF